MMKWSAVLFVTAVVTAQSVYSKTLPAFLTACKRKDPSVHKCYLTFLKTILQRSADGLPELRIPPLEPFVVPQIVVDQGASEAVKLKATLNNVSVHGITKADLTAAKANLGPEPNFEVEFSIPALRLQSDYIIDGQLLIVQIQGSGKCEMNLTDVTGSVRLYTQVVDKRGKKHLDLVRRDVDVDLKDGRFYFGNLFNGNKQLGETTNEYINENWRELYTELKPVIADSVGSVVDYIVKIVLEDYAYNEMFPEK